MTIDETALAAMRAKAQEIEWVDYAESHKEAAASNDQLAQLVQAYLDALPKPEGVPVRICVAVTPGGVEWGAAGWAECMTTKRADHDDNMRGAAMEGMDEEQVQFRWVEAVVRGYDADEPTAQGVEVEG